MVSRNRLANCKNEYQGKSKRVLCVCSAGLLRSPTAALVLSLPPFNYNTRAVGVDEDYALIPLDKVHIRWADEIVCMDKRQRHILEKLKPSVPIHNLEIGDVYEYRDPELMALIEKKYKDMVWYKGGVRVEQP